MKRKTPFTVLSDEDSEFLACLYIEYYALIKKTAYQNTNDYDNVDDIISERDRDLLKNKYFLGYSDEEISEIMNIPKNNIRQYLVLARRRLMKILKERGNIDE